MESFKVIENVMVVGKDTETNVVETTSGSFYDECKLNHDTLPQKMAEYASTQYQRDRASEYPSLQEQLDMQYWDSVNGTTVWQDTINAIKAKYPKVG